MEISQHSGRKPETYYGRHVKKAWLSNDAIHIVFAGETEIRVIDDGHQCCEHRYLTCDDDIEALEGGKLQSIEVRDGASQPDDETDGDHDTAFLIIATDKASVTATTHNKHTGYYAGFCLVVQQKWGD